MSLTTAAVRPTPRFDSFHFGLYTCASCFGALTSEERISRELARPVFGDQAETEIIIPAGRHSFHPDCWLEHKELEAMST